MTDAVEHMSQADFGRHMGVSRAAVSQWKSKEILTEAAFTKPGKKGKVVVAVAIEEVRKNRDIGQSCGNGLDTKPKVDEPPAPIAPGLPLEQPSSDEDASETLKTGEIKKAPADNSGTIEKKDSVEDLIKQAKLEEQLRKNRQAAAEEALRSGLLIASDDAREQMGRVAVTLLQTFDGALPDFATALAEKFGIPQRDALHLLKAEFVKVRDKASKKERARSEQMKSKDKVSISEDS